VNKIFAILKREYLTRVKTKGFIIGTFLLPVFIMAASLLPALLMQTNKGDAKRMVIIDKTDRLLQPLTDAFSSARDKNDKPLFILSANVEATSPEEMKNQLNKKVSDGDLDLYIILMDSVFENNKFELHAKNIGNFDFIHRVERTVSDVVRDMRFREAGMDAEVVRRLNSWVNAKTFKVDESGSKEQRAEVSFIFSLIMGMLLYMMLILYGMFVLRAVIEDKNSRVVEVIISSVKPHQFMAGKVLGIGATGLTQFAIWIATAILASTYGLTMAQSLSGGMSSFSLPTVSNWVYAAFVFYFLVGYFFYAALAAAVGSMVNNESEAQSYQWVVIMPIILSFFLMFAINNTPDSMMSVILSLIPFFTPILMFSRILQGAAPLWQVMLSIGIMGLSLWGVLWLTGRIFRVGILMYGKKPNLPEILKWIKYS
jgi:ABC-2 type transport system permease protein